jgi:hypothetical protein
MGAPVLNAAVNVVSDLGGPRNWPEIVSCWACMVYLHRGTLYLHQLGEAPNEHHS